jgi:hypothetical protein
MTTFRIRTPGVFSIIDTKNLQEIRDILPTLEAVSSSVNVILNNMLYYLDFTDTGGGIISEISNNSDSILITGVQTTSNLFASFSSNFNVHSIDKGIWIFSIYGYGTAKIYVELVMNSGTIGTSTYISLTPHMKNINLFINVPYTNVNGPIKVNLYGFEGEYNLFFRGNTQSRIQTTINDAVVDKKEIFKPSGDIIINGTLDENIPIVFPLVFTIPIQKVNIVVNNTQYIYQSITKLVSLDINVNYSWSDFRLPYRFKLSLIKVRDGQNIILFNSIVGMDDQVSFTSSVPGLFCKKILTELQSGDVIQLVIINKESYNLKITQESIIIIDYLN